MGIKKNFSAPLAFGLGATRRAAMLLLVMMLTTVTTWADNYVTLTSTTKTWENNTYVTNGNVTIANRITVKGNVTLILTDGYILTASKGIEVSEGNSLTIEGGTNGTGKLIIEGCADGKAGIGGGSGTPVKYGNITINGGIVNVKGGKKAAGIGGNNNSITGCGTITINGGIVNATGGAGAAGIGGVIYGNITINGGIVNVKGGDQSAGIGGNYNSECSGNGTITINGGIVNATGGKKAAGIGGGNGYDSAKGGCGDIVINGGQVTATGGGDGPGIGPGKGDAKKTSGSLVLGWTNTTDFIKVTGVKSNLRVVYGFSDRLKSINFAVDKKFNISGGGEATIKDITNLESVELIPKGSEQYQLSVATISGISASYDLTGSYLDIPFSVSDAEEKTLTLGTDYTATLGTTSQESTTIHITEGGKYTLTINGMGSYAGSKSVDFEVISIGFKKDANGVDYINMPKTGIDDANIPEGVSSFKVYDDGGAKAKYSNYCDGGLVLKAPDNHVLQLTGTVTAEVQGKELKDYLMVYDGGSTSAQKIGDKYGSESGENIGTLISSGTQMTLTFHSDVNGPKDGLDLTVTLKRDLGSCVIADIDDQPYTGSAIEPAVVITYKGTALVKDMDYEVTYSNNTTVGTATITITGKGNYAQTTSKTFTIVKATPNVTAPIAVADLIYTGGSLNLVAAGTTDFGTLLYSTDGNNYSEDIPTATNAGTYTVYYKVAGDANHNDVSGSIEVTITQKAVTNDDITITIPSQTWTGSELTPVITVKDGEKVLVENTDYTVTAPSGTIQDAGDYTYTISGKGNYSGEKAATFTIIPKAVTNDGITIAAIADKTYTGSAIEPEVTVTDGETTLALGTDYTIGYSANVNVGTATATITGKGNYSGEKAATFTISPKAVTNDGITIAAIADQTYTGSAIKPEVTVTDGETTLTLGTDYTIGYSANVNVGTATATITGKGNYSGEKAATFTISPKAVTNDGITVTIPSQTWTGSELTPVITVKDGETELIKNTDYTVTAPSGTIQDAGDYTYTISGVGNYSGEKAATFTIMQPKDIATCDITVPNQTMERFGGGDPYPYIYFKFEDAEYNPTSNVIGEVVTDGEKTLTLGTDYEFGMITFDGPSTHEEKINPCKPGDKCLVEIVGIGDYGGSKWVSFKITYPDANGTWGDLTWAFHDGTLTITGTGAMNATTADKYPWRSIARYVETINIGDNITTIANGAFEGTAQENPYSSVTTVSLPSTLTTIGNNAFAYCTGATITIPESVITLGANPFNQVGCVVVSKPLVDGNDNSDMISKIRFAKRTTFTYKRSFTENVASTVCLPFDYTPQEGEGTYYTFTAIDKETSPWTVTMTATDASLTANTPYMFMPAVDAVSFNGTASSFDPSNVEVNDLVVTGGKWNLIGTYESRQWDDTHNTEEIGSVYGFAAQNYDGGGSYTVNPGDFVKAMAGASIAPFRAYLKYTAPVSNAPRRGAAEEALPSRMSVRLVNADGDVTAIGTIDTKTGEIRFDSEAWYTLDGRRLNGKPSVKGMYINNGKKIIVK